jgi:hypothetical protein
MHVPSREMRKIPCVIDVGPNNETVKYFEFSLIFIYVFTQIAIRAQQDYPEKISPSIRPYSSSERLIKSDSGLPATLQKFISMQ